MPLNVQDDEGLITAAVRVTKQTPSNDINNHNGNSSNIPTLPSTKAPVSKFRDFSDVFSEVSLKQNLCYICDTCKGAALSDNVYV